MNNAMSLDYFPEIFGKVAMEKDMSNVLIVVITELTFGINLNAPFVEVLVCGKLAM